ncbi:MAG: hypothetical protein H6716_24010 [Polyangiaceae bacterium]|nr:hypothetical protein [Polyangiaceae bacterium]
MIEHRFVGDLELVTPLKLSSGDEADLADSALRRNGNGSLVVPGTSIAGAFRAYVETIANGSCGGVAGSPGRATKNLPACACDVCRLFGDVNPGSSPDAHASRVTFQDAVVVGGRVRVVDGVAIERRRRAPSERRKFDFEEVEPGARICVEVRGAGLIEREVNLIRAAFRALGSGAMPLGGRVAQGCGRFFAKADVAVRRRDTSTPEHLIAALLNDVSSDDAWPEQGSGVRDSDMAAPELWSMTFELHSPDGGTFLVADPREAVATGFDRAPRGGVEAVELPASSFRGALRAASERILRTLDPETACDPTVREGCCAAKERESRKRDAPRKSDAPPPERCLACQVFGNEEWGSWLRVDVRRKVSDAEQQSPATGKPFDHVAIDRFTGGARKGLKFDALVSRSPKFDVTLTAPTLPEGDRAWVSGLLALAVRDLHDGRWQLGHGSARGHGWFTLAAKPCFVPKLDEQALKAAVQALWSKTGVSFPETK